MTDKAYVLKSQGEINIFWQPGFQQKESENWKPPSE